MLTMLPEPTRLATPFGHPLAHASSFPLIQMLYLPDETLTSKATLYHSLGSQLPRLWYTEPSYHPICPMSWKAKYARMPVDDIRRKNTSLPVEAVRMRPSA